MVRNSTRVSYVGEGALELDHPLLFPRVHWQGAGPEAEELRLEPALIWIADIPGGCLTHRATTLAPIFEVNFPFSAGQDSSSVTGVQGPGKDKVPCVTVWSPVAFLTHGAVLSFLHIP